MPKQKLLLPFVQKYFEKDPASAAHNLEAMSEQEAVEVLKILPSAISVSLFPFLQPSYAASLLSAAPEELFKDVVTHLDPQQGAHIFSHLKEDVRQRLIESLPEKTKHLLRELLTYPLDSAGHIMSTQVIALRQDITVKQAVQKIKHLVHNGFPASYAYVVDEDRHLVGVINMRDLMLSSTQAILSEVVHKDVFAINCFTDREVVARELSQKRYFAAPVVDAENRLLGVVRAEQLIKEVNEEATEDMQKMFGAGGDEKVFSSLWFAIKKRLPWLHVNLATAFIAAAVVALFEGIIAKLTILAVFLPVVAGQGGNAGAQSLAVVMRGLVMREIPAKRVKQLIFKEIGVGAINGLVIGVVTALIAWFWQGNSYLGLVIGLGMIVNLIVAGLAGASIPILMKRIGLDPAQSSSIILTTVTDVIGFFAFLGFAVIFQSFLL